MEGDTTIFCYMNAQDKYLNGLWLGCARRYPEERGPSYPIVTWYDVKSLRFFSNTRMCSVSPGLQHLAAPAVSKLRCDLLLAAIPKTLPVLLLPGPALLEQIFVSGYFPQINLPAFSTVCLFACSSMLRACF